MLFAGFLSSLLACNDASDARLNSAVYAVREQTLAPGAELKSFSPVDQGKKVIQSTWEIETSQDWTEYKKAVATRLRPQYSMTREAEGEFLMHRDLGGDTHGVHVVVVSRGPPLRIRVTFQAYAS